MIDYLSFSVGFLIVMYFFEVYIHSRQHALYLLTEPPKRIISLVDEKNFKKTQKYNRDKSLYDFVKMTLDFIFALTFYFKISDFFYLSESIAYSLRPKNCLMHSNEFLTDAVFLTGLILITDLLELPLTLYKAFVIEAKHGFNKMTLRVFVSDWVKMLFLKLVALYPVVGVYLALVANTGGNFPIYVWAFFFAFKLVLMNVYPRFIQPCFNRVEELPQGDLRSKIEALAVKVGYPLRKLFTIDGSKRSSHSNAYLYGLCNNKRIVLFDTLIEQCSVNEIVAVLGHELGHWKNWHVVSIFMLTETTLFSTFFMLRLFLYSEELYRSFGFDRTHVLMGTFLFFFIYDPVSHLFTLVFNFFSRRFEFQADDFAQKMGHGEDLKNALLVLEKKNQMGMLVDPLFALYNYTHPPIIDRIERIK